MGIGDREMRVNVYAEEMTDRVELVTKGEFTGIRFYLELPVTPTGNAKEYQIKGPFFHHPGDDDSAAVTFWGKKELRKALLKALALLDAEALTTRMEVNPPKVMDFSGWVGHRARTANGKTVKVIGLLTSASIYGEIEGLPDNYVKKLYWDLSTGKSTDVSIPEWDLVELLDGPTKNRKGE